MKWSFEHIILYVQMIFSYNLCSTYVSSMQAFIQDFGPGGVGWTQGGCRQILIPAHHS